MHIKLIRPTNYDENLRLIKEKKATVPNLTLFYLSSFVPKNHKVSVVDESVEDIDFNEPVDMVGISVTTPTASRAYEIAREFRNRKIPVVLGGIHVTCMPNEALKNADSIVIGEAENTWPELIKDFENGKLKKIYKESKRESLEGLPHPRFDLIKKDKYLRLPPKKSLVIPIQTSRGCPYDCDFCVVTKFWGKKIRYRPIKDIVDEIKASKGKIFFFTDDNFLSNPKRTFELCKAIRPLNIKWVCQLDTGSYRYEKVIKTMSRSGCFLAFIGIESLNPETLEEINKRANKPKNYDKLFEVMNKNNINVYASIIFGFDRDNIKVVINTVKFLIKNKVSLAAFFPLSPIPATKLYERLKETNRLLDNNWWLSKDPYVRKVRIKYEKGKPTGTELSKYAMYMFYSYPSIFKRFFSLKKNKIFPIILNLDIKNKLKRSPHYFM